MKTLPFTKPWTLALLAMSCACAVSAQNVPDTTLVAGISPISQAAHSWSAKNQILGRSVYNEQGQKIGKVDDVIVAPNNSLSFAIIGIGGFAGLRRHQIALPVGHAAPPTRKLLSVGRVERRGQALAGIRLRQTDPLAARGEPDAGARVAQTSGARIDQDDFARTGSFQSGRMKWQV